MTDGHQRVKIPGLNHVRGIDGFQGDLHIFSEHKDTLTDLADNIRALIGRPEAVVIIHGGISRQERRAVEVAFREDPQVTILVATDAAGEGIFRLSVGLEDPRDLIADLARVLDR